MARMDDRIVAKCKEYRADGRHERGVVAARQIGAADRSGEKRVADEEVFAGFSAASNLQTDATRAMSRRMVRARFKPSKGDHLTRLVVDVDRRLRLDMQAED